MLSTAEHLLRRREFDAGHFLRLAENAERRAADVDPENARQFMAWARYYRNAANALLNVEVEA